ncbi:MAG: PorT family protein [Bacteroidales bacterium]|nr:PorT family protein [Bacteroidales bacterium]
MAFLVLMVNIFLSIKHIFRKKRLSSLSVSFLILFALTSDLNSQELVFGFTGGLNMNTISTKESDGGLKMGANIGGIAQLKLNDEMSLMANLRFSSKGQQFSKIIDSNNNYLKIYNSTSLYYIDIPLLYQYYFEDIIGVEAGPTFNFCLGGKNKEKIGNEEWNVTKFEKGTYNPFEFGLAFGIFTRDLGQSAFNNIFIEFRYFIGLTDFIKDYDRNTNTGVFLNIGYIIEHPLKKK